jgi:hypothetical protein
MATLISTTFLRDVNHGGSASQPGDVARALGDFISQAKKSVHVAIYDFRLSDALAAPVVEALKTVASKG